MKTKKERPQTKHLDGGFKDHPERINKKGRTPGTKNHKTIVTEFLDKVMDMKKFSPKNAAALSKMGITTKDDLEALMTAAQAVKALAGDSRAYEMLMDRRYGKPQQSIDHTTKGDKVTLPRVQLTKKG